MEALPFVGDPPTSDFTSEAGILAQMLLETAAVAVDIESNPNAKAVSNSKELEFRSIFRLVISETSPVDVF